MISGASGTSGGLMCRVISEYIANESGSAAAEYALILVIIGTAIFAALGVLGADIVAALHAAGAAVAGYTY